MSSWIRWFLPYYGLVFAVLNTSAITSGQEENDVRTLSEKRFDEAVFSSRYASSPESARIRLAEVLARRVQQAVKRYGLDQAQKQKLELAGRGAIKQLFQRIDDKKQAILTDATNNARVFPAALLRRDAEIEEFHLKFKSGPFNDESLFAKTLQTLLTLEQSKIYDRSNTLSTTSTKRIDIDNVANMVRTGRFKKTAYRLVWNRAGTFLAVVEINRPVEIYSPPSEQPVQIIGEGKGLIGFDFHPDDRLVAIGENSKTAAILNLKNGTEIQINADQQQPSVKFSPDGKWLATGGYGRSAKLWSTSTGEYIRDFDVGPNDGGLTPVFSPDGTILAVGHRNSTTRLFDVASGKLLHTLPRTMTHGLAFDPTGQKLAVTYVDAHLVVWDVQTGKSLHDVLTDADELYSVDWSPDGSLLATAGRNSQVTLWNSADLTLLTELESPSWVISAQFSLDGTKLFFAGGSERTPDKFVETWAVP